MAAKKYRVGVAFLVSIEEVNHKWTMPYTHYHEHYEIYILESGQRIVTIDEREYETLAGDAVLFAPMIPHTSRGSSSYSGICIQFSEAFLRKYYTEPARRLLLKCFEKNMLHLKPEQVKAIKVLAARYDMDDPGRFLILGQLLEIFRIYAEQTQKENALSRQVEPESKRSLIMNYVDENFAVIKEIKDLSQRFQVSEGYIFRIFKESLGTTPKQYINKLRIEAVVHMMQFSRKPTKSIAADCGFECYEYFLRVFKKYMGCSPSEYRRKVVSTSLS